MRRTSSGRGWALIDPIAPTRGWLAAVLRDEIVSTWPEIGQGESLAVATARLERVVCLTHQRLHEGPNAGQCPPALGAAFALAARSAATRSLAQIRECRQISTLLADAGIPALFVKGSALGQWLYRTPYLRECADIDLLLQSRADVEKAIDVLLSVGYLVPERTIPGDLIVYELACVSTNTGSSNFEIDLHWKLCNSSLLCDCLQWQELHAAAIPLPGMGAAAKGLSPVHAFLHVCLNRALDQQQGNGNLLRCLHDLKLFAQQFDAGQWQSTLILAKARQVAGICADGLMVAQRDVGALVPPQVLEALLLAARDEPLNVTRLQDWRYVQWATLRALPTWQLRLRWVWQRLWPNPNHVREHFPRIEGYGMTGFHWRHLKRAFDRILRGR